MDLRSRQRTAVPCHLSRAPSGLKNDPRAYAMSCTHIHIHIPPPQMRRCCHDRSACWFPPLLLIIVLLSSHAIQTAHALISRRVPMASASSNLNIKSRDPVSNMPWLGLGTWRSETGKVKEAVCEAIRLGYMHLDCAQVYENQHEVGEGVQEAVAKGYISNAGEVWITSKIWNTDHRKEHVRPAAERILRELEKLVDEGLVETIGLSNFNEQEVEDILAIAKIKPVVNQVEAHPYLPQDALKTFLDSKGIALCAYSPLSNLDPNDPSKPSALRDEAILSIAKKHGKTPAQVIIRWHLQKGHICIPKTVTPQRLVENADVYDFALDNEDMSLIAETGKKHKARLVNPGFKPAGQPVFTDEA